MCSLFDAQRCCREWSAASASQELPPQLRQAPNCTPGSAHQPYRGRSYVLLSQAEGPSSTDWQQNLGFQVGKLSQPHLEMPLGTEPGIFCMENRSSTPEPWPSSPLCCGSSVRCTSSHEAVTGLEKAARHTLCGSLHCPHTCALTAIAGSSAAQMLLAPTPFLGSTGTLRQAAVGLSADRHPSLLFRGLLSIWGHFLQYPLLSCFGFPPLGAQGHTLRHGGHLSPGANSAWRPHNATGLSSLFPCENLGAALLHCRVDSATLHFKVAILRF